MLLSPVVYEPLNNVIKLNVSRSIADRESSNSEKELLPFY